MHAASLPIISAALRNPAANPQETRIMAKLTMGVLGTALAGTTGTAVFADTPYGTIVRSRPIRSDTHTLAQAQQQFCFTRAQSEYRTLTRPQNAAWKQYALSPLNADPDTGQLGGRTAYAAFVSLATRFLSLHPQGTPPHLPPQFPYAGDPLTFAVTLPPGQIVLEASAANTASTRTVIQLLALKFESQSYRLRDLKTVETVRFTPDALSLVIAVEPGWYALATYFASVQTGQHTARVEYKPFEVAAV